MSIRKPTEIGSEMKLFAIIIVSLFALATPESVEARSSKKSYKKKRYKSSKRKPKFTMRRSMRGKGKYSGGHHHHAHAPKGFSLGLGATAAFAMGGSASEDSHDHAHEGEGHEDHDHSHSLALHGGDGHSHGSHSHGSSSGSAGAGPSISLLLTPNYQFSDSWGTSVVFGYDVNAGLLDPTPTISHHWEMTRRWMLESSINTSIPVSKASQESGLLTRTTFTSGPTYSKGKWFASVQGLVSMSFYNSQVEEEEDEHADGFHLLDEHDHEHEGEEAHDEHDDHGHENENNQQQGQFNNQQQGPSSNQQNQQVPNFQNQNFQQDDAHAADHDHEDEHDHDAERVTMSVGGLANVGYQFTRNLVTTHGGGMTINQLQGGDQNVTTEATLARANYFMGDMTASGWLSLSNTAESFSIPSTPMIGIGLDQRF